MRRTRSLWPRLIAGTVGTALVRALFVSLGLTVSLALFELLPALSTDSVPPPTDAAAAGSGAGGEQEPSPSPGVRPARVVYAGPLVSGSGSGTNPPPHRETRSAADGRTAGIPAVSPPPSAEISSTAPEAADARGAPPTVTAAGTDAAVRAEAPVRPVDLNTASVEELNALGGGMIGRAIVRGRPYTSVEDLVAKRVLSRSTFQRVADQVSVR